MNSQLLFDRYRELQSYVGWTPEDAERIKAIAPLLNASLPGLIEDFYAEIERHPTASRVITGGAAQIERLKGTLTNWLRELLSGQYDADYVSRRWRVGYRHVEIGLDQVYTNVALSRLRFGLHAALSSACREGRIGGHSDEFGEIVGSLNKLLDLDLAIIEDAYQAEYMRRQQQSERLAAIGQLGGGVAHELRNPLNVIRTSVYYLLNARNATPAKIAEHLARIEKQVGLADGVITALSNFARMPVPNLEPFEVEPWIRDVVDGTSLPGSIEVSIRCEPALPAALADREQLRIVLSNLVRNAREAMPEGGKLTIESSMANEHLEMTVQDTGPGVRPEDLSRIMEPLYTTKARGIGLGLALARAIVERNAGKLSVASEFGRGTTFTIRLRASSTGQST